jgi:hypothetical protein
VEGLRQTCPKDRAAFAAAQIGWSVNRDENIDALGGLIEFEIDRVLALHVAGVTEVFPDTFPRDGDLLHPFRQGAVGSVNAAAFMPYELRFHFVAPLRQLTIDPRELIGVADDANSGNFSVLNREHE